jgi:SNF2 family DNA or RNA helicase
MTFKGTLLPFQEEAVARMVDRKAFLLAHSMGLGKTVQAIAATEQLIDEGKIQSVLIICPASIKWQWKRQIDRFTDGALVKVIEGDKGKRKLQYRTVRRGDLEYVIMNYEQIVADWDIVRLLDFDAVVCDEVVAVKNPRAARSRHIKRLRTPYRFGLTGQPIENRPEELFSLMEFIDKDVLGDALKFERTFIARRSNGTVSHYRNLKLLRRTMKTAMHRKTRSDPDIREQMPAVVEKPYYIDLDPVSKRLYRRIAGELISIIHSSPSFASFNVYDHYAGTEEGGIQGEVMPRLMALRMLCDHPALLTYSADAFDDPDTKAGSRYLAELRNTGALDTLPPISNKLKETLGLIGDILDADPHNKVVLFSFFKPMLAIISSKLRVDHELFTGDLTPRERDAAVERFSSQDHCRVLLSSDAGGIGVDIPVANFLLSFDLPWSAGKFDQRNGRIIRISSEWPEVTLLSMITRGSIEERQAEMLEEKSKIAAAWLDGKGVTREGDFHLSLGTLVDFLSERY